MRIAWKYCMKRVISLAWVFVVLQLSVLSAAWGDVGDVPTRFSNIDSIYNTRHNMTQRQASGAAITGPNGTLISQFMDYVRNDYAEVCVYCHTPHGANTTVAVPLWNRTIKATTYSTYNELGTSSLTQSVSQPGAASLSCLSCHDGQTAIDSVINMPGSGRYLQSQETSVSKSFLDSWTTPSQAGLDPPSSFAPNSHHNTMVECAGCHGSPVPMATNFAIFITGTDLRNDHPVGVDFPATNGPGTDFNTPGGGGGTTSFFDTDADSILDKAELRMYNGKVECASCHDPHGVPSAGAGSQFNPTFLRKTNAGSAVCLTCHAK